MKIKAEVSEKSNLTHSSALFIKLFADFIHYSNFPVAFCTASAAAGSFYLNNIPTNFNCLLFIFCSTAFIYNLDRLRPSKSDKLNSPDRTQWIKKNTTLLKSSTVAHFLICLYILIQQAQFYTYLSAGVLLSLCLLYKTKLQTVPAMKNFLVASVWTVTVSILPSIWLKSSININFVLFCFLAALINTIIFDERDAEGDRLNKVKSIPLILSKKNCSRLVWVLAALTIILSISSQMPILALIPISYLSIYNWKESQKKCLMADLVLALPAILFWL